MVTTVTVIGANGTMGANVCGIFASFGDAKVYMVCRNLESAEKSVAKAVKSVRADSIAKNLIPMDFSSLEKCVAESDLIFESVKEDLQIKSEIAKRIASSMKDDAFSCTGTSGLSINELAKCYPENKRKNFFGVHLFNPPYSMPLCELIKTEYSDAEKYSELKKYLVEKLHRTVVDVEDKPAFLANRIGFQFINSALQYAEKYKDNGGIDYIDSILGTFTGRAMAPLVTADFVGLDVHKAIVDNIYSNTNDYAHDTFALPEFVENLIKDGKLGRKTGCGLYRRDVNNEGKTIINVYDISSGEYREKLQYKFPFAEKMKKYIRNGEYKKAFECLINNQSTESKICLDFLISYIVYSLYVASEVGENALSADDVMATGFNWCPPIAMIEAFSDVVDFEKLAIAHFDNEDLICELLKTTEKSKYDYRPFFKSSK